MLHNFAEPPVQQQAAYPGPAAVGKAKPSTCHRCGKEMAQPARGRRRKFCSPACKQRAYEQRHQVLGTPIPADAVIMTQSRAANLRDGLFELRCLAEDIAMAAREGASARELREMCEELVPLARKLEELR